MKKQLSIFLLALTLPSLAAVQEEAAGAAAGAVADSAAGLMSKIVSLLAPIGAMFGSATGIRIGGSTGTGVLLLIAAVFLRSRIPFWLKIILFIGGGTMLAGGGANIMQLVSGFAQ